MKNRKTTTTLDLARSIRKMWVINPRSRVHLGKKGIYKRSETRKAEREW